MFSPLAENGCYLDKTARNHSQVCQHHHHFFTLVSGSLSLASCCTTMEKLLHTQSSLMAKAYNQHIQAFNSIQFELVRGFQYIIDISKD
ncbi:hypothetical protein JHK82_041617 [Glycine max]|uniref:Uncharacterized protein n=1 Tax=Glycine max TaxID=3847 RepID=K7MA36_SOYBN|nr:hypothetical protein JHK87_041571 [Glycine soja]KAG4948432.1 hypothetical protein JHK86_041671 [Glycine max]KAG4955902.1 hypothetical protein JHK85_042282 [Glycine max]KAG5104647.1 hypothetical protein JHK82_041617 [Glycine max]KAG5115771.1 hypothetical protein JHK84_041884 [Glycine max]